MEQPNIQMSTCEFCKKAFKTAYTLKTHQTTAKTCIRLQQELGVANLVNKRVSCSYCNKQLTSKSKLDSHLMICLKKQQHDLIEAKNQDRFELLQKELNKLEEQLQNIQSSTNNSNNVTNSHNTLTTNNNISIVNYMTEDRVLQIFRDHFNKNDLPEKKLADFTYKWFLKGVDKPVYLCTDPTRKRFVFMDQDGKEVVDRNCSTLISLLYQAQPYIKDLVQDEIIDQEQNEIDLIKDQYKAFLNLEQDGTDYKLELAKRLPASIQAMMQKGPPKDDIDWDINKKLNPPQPDELKEEIGNPDDPWGMFA